MDILATITTGQHTEALIAEILAALWLVILVLLHFIKPALKPSVHMMSEYAIKPQGWIMQMAFFCISASCFAAVLATWSHLPHFGLVLLAIDGIGFAGAGTFVTDAPSSPKGTATTKGGTLHSVFSIIVISLFPITATVVSLNISSSPIWASVHTWLPVLSLLTWAGFIGFIGCSAIYSAKRKVAPVGYYQRFMVLTYTAWLIVFTSAMI